MSGRTESQPGIREALPGNWLPVARKDFQDAIRSRLLVGLMMLFLAVVLGGTALFIRLGDTSGFDGVQAALLLVNRFRSGLLIVVPSPVKTIVPIAAIAASYRSIAGERDTGSIKLLLSLPHSRGDALVGKFLGRSAVVTLPVVVGVVLAIVYTLFEVGALSLTVFLPFVLATLAYVTVWVAIGVAVSAAASSTSRAALGGIAALAVFKYLWGLLNDIVVYVIANGASGPFIGQSTPAWSQYLRRLTPEAAYDDAVITFLRATTGEQVPAQPADTSLMLQDEWGVVLLVLWIVLPLAVAYLRFEGAELS